MIVLQSNGKKEGFLPNKIVNKINSLSKDLKNIDRDSLSQQIISNIIDGITTKEISELSAAISAYKINISYEYSILAARLVIDSLYKTTPSKFIDSIETLNNSGYLSEAYYNKIKSYDLNRLESAIVYSRDMDYDFLAACTLSTVYLMKDKDGKVVERPQHMHMRVATFLTDTEDEAIELYKYLSLRLISPASPIIFNSGTKKSTLVSCNLISMLSSTDQLTGEYKDPDSLEGIHNTYLQASKLSSGAAGIGLNVTPIRSRSSMLSTTNGKAAGVHKIMMKPINSLMLAYDQSGKRKGAAALYIEPWHMDIEDFLGVRRITADSDTACRDIFIAIWMNDLFMQRLERRVTEGKSDHTNWTLFCPNELKINGYPDLQTLFGNAFKEVYEKAEADPNVKKKTLDILDIWTSITNSQQESGMPYITYKDRVNESNMQSNMGVIKQSNLCNEIIQYTDETTVANCILSAIPIGNKTYIVNNNGNLVFNFELLEEAVYQTVKYLNKLCDINRYPTPQTEKGGKEQRAIAVGTMGFADLLFGLDLDYDSQEAIELSTSIAEYIYYYTLKASNELAKEQGRTYPSFKDSDYAKGILHFDKYLRGKNINYKTKLDWEGLKEDIKEHGLLNSLLVARMPTASSAAIQGCNEADEPVTDLIFKRKLLSGEFAIVNKYMIKDLEDLGLWCESLKDQILEEESLSNIFLERYSSSKTAKVIEEKGFEYISARIQKIKSKYRTAWELGAKPIINLAAARQPFIDQTQSMNLWMGRPDRNKLTSMHLHAWKKGLKTGMYYLRSLPANSADKALGISSSKQRTKQVSNGEIDCIGCTV